MELKRWQEENNGADLYCVIGDPITQSKSPLMHNQAFRELGLNAVYGAFQVKENELADFMQKVRDYGIAGLNVTIPHKLNVMEFLDEIDQDAQELGAVNTIVNRNGKLVGYNTDGIGYVRSLKEETMESLKHKRIVVIGAGGAARGIIHALLKEKPESILLVNRSIDRAEQLAASLKHDGVIAVHSFEEIQHACNHADVVINTTSVGMYPHDEQQPAQGAWLKAGAVASDLIYNPLYTRFVLDAEQNGCQKHGGLGMFIYQGAYAFEYWTGRQAPVDVMRNAVLQALT